MAALRITEHSLFSAKPIRAGHHSGMGGVQTGIRAGGVGAPVAIRAGQKPE